MELRAYQQNSIDGLYSWWQKHAGIADCPLLVLPTGAGKSVVIAELVRLLFDTWPESHPRTVVLVPSKELAEQNADKLMRILPSHIRVGYYSASLGRKQPDADVIVATIGSIAKNAHLLGNIRCVVIDECHLVSPDGAGQYRQFLNDLARYCVFRVVGFTATPFRGNGVWLTDGDDPLFTGIAHETPVSELLQAGYLSPLIRPIDAIQSRIDTSGIGTSNGDYNINQLSDRVSDYLPAAADEACSLAADRHKWIAFLPTVANAESFADMLNQRGVPTLVVCGDTPKKEREQRIASFRHGEVRCLVTVLALATGFDVPDVDCIIWLRPTQSPVLYCFDAETEILTSHGWKGIDDVREGDCALARDMESGTGKWSRVLGVVRRQMDDSEKWVEYDAPRANFRVTDQHRMIFKTKKHHDWRIGTAAEIASYRDSIYMPTAVHIEHPGVPLTDDELYLIGILMTDGTWSPVQAQISQSERYPKVLARIEETLERMNIQWKKSKICADSNFIQRFDRWVFTISMGEPRKGSAKNGIRYLQPYLHKDLAPALMALSKAQFIKLVEGLWDGDGVKMEYVKDWTVRGKTIVSARKTCIERIQALAVMHGFTAYLRWEHKGRKNPLGVITIKDQDWRSVSGPHKERRPKIVMKPATDEEVWCVETEHGTVVTRRRGKVTVMGNCQGAGRGLRIAEGKQNCLWVDFSDTTERLGPVDGIRGRKRGRKKLDAVAPFAVCGNCGNQVRPASAMECPDCGTTLREPEPEESRSASNAAIMAHQVQPNINTYPIDRVSYARHQKPGSPDSLRAEYWCGLRIVAREWVCLNHQGFARAKAERWWSARNPEGFSFIPGSVDQAFEWLDDGFELRKPVSIAINESGKYPEIVSHQWETAYEPHAA